jgi:hypothetical protein
MVEPEHHYQSERFAQLFIAHIGNGPGAGLDAASKLAKRFNLANRGALKIIEGFSLGNLFAPLDTKILPGSRLSLEDRANRLALILDTLGVEKDSEIIRVATEELEVKVKYPPHHNTKFKFTYEPEKRTIPPSPQLSFNLYEPP